MYTTNQSTHLQQGITSYMAVPGCTVKPKANSLVKITSILTRLILEYNSHTLSRIINLDKALQIWHTQRYNRVPVQVESKFVEKVCGMIEADVCKCFNLPCGILRQNKSRKPGIAHPRQLAQALSSLAGVNLGKAGIFFAGKDHATVLYAVAKLKTGFLKDIKGVALYPDIKPIAWQLLKEYGLEDKAYE